MGRWERGEWWVGGVGGMVGRLEWEGTGRC